MTETENEIEREESQTILRSIRKGDNIRLKIAGREAVTLDLDEYERLLKEIRRTKWLLKDAETLEGETKATKIDGQWMGKGECHECGFEGYLVENDIGTVLCPKCRSTNVGWPVR